MTDNKTLGLIKVCGDPGCEAIFHNIPKKHTRCNDCNGRLIEINEDTFWIKYSNNYFNTILKQMNILDHKNLVTN